MPNPYNPNPYNEDQDRARQQPLYDQPGMLRKIIFIQSAQTHPAFQWLSP